MCHSFIPSSSGFTRQKRLLLCKSFAKVEIDFISFFSLGLFAYISRYVIWIIINKHWLSVSISHFSGIWLQRINIIILRKGNKLGVRFVKKKRCYFFDSSAAFRINLAYCKIHWAVWLFGFSLSHRGWVFRWKHVLIYHIDWIIETDVLLFAVDFPIGLRYVVVCWRFVRQFDEHDSWENQHTKSIDSWVHMS